MSILVASFLIPKNNQTWYVVEDKFMKGGLHVVANAAERDAINPVSLKASMLAITQDDNKIWQLAADKVTWNAFSAGGGSGVSPRMKIDHPITAIAPGDSIDFNLILGKTVIVLYLGVTVPCMVQVFETEDRFDENPYTFIATSDHLVDDGSTKMTDGTILRGRRYSILANRSPIPVADQYFRVSNVGSTSLDTVLSVEYISIE
jgi:hypothetical protein